MELKYKEKNLPSPRLPEYTLEKTEGAIKNGHSPRETGNIGYTRHRAKTNKAKTQHNMRWMPLCANKHK